MTERFPPEGVVDDEDDGTGFHDPDDPETDGSTFDDLADAEKVKFCEAEIASALAKLDEAIAGMAARRTEVEDPDGFVRFTLGEDGRLLSRGAVALCGHHGRVARILADSTARRIGFPAAGNPFQFEVAMAGSPPCTANEAPL